MAVLNFNLLTMLADSCLCDYVTPVSTGKLTALALQVIFLISIIYLFIIIIITIIIIIIIIILLLLLLL